MSDGSLDVDAAYVAAIEEENEILREKVIALEELVGYRQEVPLVFGLTAQEERVIGFLLKRDVGSKEQIMNAIYTDRPWIDVEIKIVDVFICKARKKLTPFGVEISTVWGRGYQMAQASKDIIKKMLKPQESAA